MRPYLRIVDGGWMRVSLPSSGLVWQGGRQRSGTLEKWLLMHPIGVNGFESLKFFGISKRVRTRSLFYFLLERKLGGSIMHHYYDSEFTHLCSAQYHIHLLFPKQNLRTSELHCLTWLMSSACTRVSQAKSRQDEPICHRSILSTSIPFNQCVLLQAQLAP